MTVSPTAKTQPVPSPLPHPAFDRATPCARGADIPEIAEVYACPTLRGAVGSVCGKDYVMHPHRHM